ncbi:MAG: Flp family type IVb pilin [Dehalococcoidia bacterium]
MTTFINALLTSLYVRVTDEERGQGLVEYGLIIALIAVLLVASLTGLKSALVDTFTSITGKL